MGNCSLRAGTGFTTLVAFTYTNAPNYGWNFEPSSARTGALVQGDDGNFYGSTFVGGVTPSSLLDGGDGAIFRMTPDGEFTLLHSFGGTRSPFATSLDGTNPIGDLIKGADGSFYGATVSGGTIDHISNGTLFRITPSGALTTLYSFGSQGDFIQNDVLLWPDGRFPGAGLVQGRDGNFYGTTTDSGTNNYGTVFRLTPGGVLGILHSFAAVDNGFRNPDGALPYSELVEGSDGYFYGTASLGGVHGYGTVFKISPTGSFSTLHSFDRATGGGLPTGGLLLASDGNFYGIANFGPGNNGVIFKMTPSGVLTALFSFDGNNGAEPRGGLIQGTDGNFYGTTSGGGKTDTGNPSGWGTVFQVTPAGVMTTLHSFSGPDGSQPQGTLVQGRDGYLYGTTSYGGPGFIPFEVGTGYGTVFRLPIPPMFQSIALVDGILKLSWSAMPGQRYQLQSTASLSSPHWVDFGDVVTSSGVAASAAHAGNGAPMFFRIVLL